MKKISVVSAVGFMLLSSVQAVPMFVTRIPNGDKVPGIKALGHEDTIGEDTTRNLFGIAFEEAGTEWTNELCEADSDEDGQTNGQELGDPCCIWKEDDEPQWTTGVSHPGVKSKTSDSSRWTKLDCEAIRAQAEAKAEAEADAEASKNSPDGGEDSDVDISMGDGNSSGAAVLASSIALAAIPMVMLLLW